MTPVPPDLASALPAGITWDIVSTEIAGLLGAGIVASAIVAGLAVKFAPKLVGGFMRVIRKVF